MNQQTLQNKIKQQLKANNVTTCKNTELYKLFDIKDTDNPYEVAKILNDYLYQTTRINSNNNGIYMPTLAAYLFFLKNRKDLLDNLIVYKTAQKPYISIKKEIPENYVTLRQWMARTMLIHTKHLQANSFKKVKQLKLIAANPQLEEYLGYFLILEDLQNITIFGDYNNPSTNLKNLVIFFDLQQCLGALLYKKLREKKPLSDVFKETNFVVLNNSENVLNKIDDIVLYSSLTNTNTIAFNSCVPEGIKQKIIEKIEDFYEDVGVRTPNLVAISPFDFVKEAKRLIKTKEKDVKNKRDIGLSIA